MIKKKLLIQILQKAIPSRNGINVLRCSESHFLETVLYDNLESVRSWHLIPIRLHRENCKLWELKKYCVAFCFFKAKPMYSMFVISIALIYFGQGKSLWKLSLYIYSSTQRMDILLPIASSIQRMEILLPISSRICTT